MRYTDRPERPSSLLQIYLPNGCDALCLGFSVCLVHISHFHSTYRMNTEIILIMLYLWAATYHRVSESALFFWLQVVLFGVSLTLPRFLFFLNQSELVKILAKSTNNWCDERSLPLICDFSGGLSLELLKLAIELRMEGLHFRKQQQSQYILSTNVERPYSDQSLHNFVALNTSTLKYTIFSSSIRG